MLFNTIFTTVILLSSLTLEQKTGQKNIKYFKNLTPIVYKDSLISSKKHVYVKVPTKIIKNNKNSN